MLLVLAALGYLLYQLGILQLFQDVGALQELVRGFGVWAPLVFIVLQIVQVIFSFIPGNITTMAGAALFGMWRGFFLSYLAISAASLLAFLIARKLGTRVVRRLVGGQSFDRYFVRIHSAGALSRTRITLICMMLLPFFPDDLLCLLAGITALPFAHFVAIVLLTRPWGLLFSALLGSGAMKLPVWALGLLVVCSLGLGLLAARYATRIETFFTTRISRITSKVQEKVHRPDKE